MQNKLELWSSFLLAFFKLTKQQIIIKNKRKENVMNFEMVILRRAREKESESERKRECRREAKLNKKKGHTKQRESKKERERFVHALFAEERAISRPRNANALSLSFSPTVKENNRHEIKRKRERERLNERARRGRRSQKIVCGEGMLGFITITTANKGKKTTEKQC